MSNKISIPHDAIVFVGDGRKALFLRNAGDEKFPNLKTEQVFVDQNPATHDQGSDRPGRLFAGASARERRSAVEPTDWHQLEEHRFARMVADAFEKLVRERKVKAVVIAAPPRTLAELRQALHGDVKARIMAEVDKDFTKHPVYEIEKHLVG
jgi:protein required for attachment to host cells